ncbi:hypothetical protein [Oleidesulfovibrio alaskensis]|jgi:hypothetical protein
MPRQQQFVASRKRHTLQVAKIQKWQNETSCVGLRLPVLSILRLQGSGLPHGRGAGTMQQTGI